MIYSEESFKWERFAYGCHIQPNLHWAPRPDPAVLAPLPLGAKGASLLSRIKTGAAGRSHAWFLSANKQAHTLRLHPGFNRSHSEGTFLNRGKMWGKQFHAMSADEDKTNEGSRVLLPRSLWRIRLCLWDQPHCTFCTINQLAASNDNNASDLYGTFLDSGHTKHSQHVDSFIQTTTNQRLNYICFHEIIHHN